jgi:hypothetical protein
VIPTLAGRIQTRIFVLAVIGSLTTLLISLVLPKAPDSIGETYKTTFAVLIAVTVLGIGWELVYHGLMQFRWEKDWPTLFGLITAVNEGFVVWLLVRDGSVPGLPFPVSTGVFLVQFLTTWILVWLAANGPMRVPFVHWRFRGGRLI